MEKNEASKERSISIGVFWKIFRKHWIFLIVVSLLVAIGVGVACGVLYRPVWSSSAQFYVSNVSETTYLYSSGQTTGAKEMVANCESFLRGSVVLNQVIEELNDPRFEQTPEGRAKLNSMIKVKIEEDTAIFSVSVSHTDQDLTPKVIHAIEKFLPAACDEFNNQNIVSSENTTGDGGTVGENDVTTSTPVSSKTESLMLKVVSSGERDTSPDNTASLIKRPVFAGFLTFVLLYAILLVIRLTDMTVYAKEDLQEKVNVDIPTFGVIPHWSSNGGKTGKKSKNLTKKQRIRRRNVEDLLITRTDVPFDIDEAFHQLCTNVTFCSTGEKGCTVGVLSTYAASGKSFVMANLAVSLSHQIDKKVLLIDADMRCPMLHKIFQYQNNCGLSNLLAGQVSDSESITHHLDSLDIITAGTLPPNPIELLSGPNMEKLMEKWKKEYDYILVDLPPVGEVSDAVAVSRLISGYLFVVRSGINDARAIGECCGLIQSHGAKIFGYVLTDVVAEHMHSYSSYNKYYYYRYSDKKHTKKNAPKA